MSGDPSFTVRPDGERQPDPHRAAAVPLPGSGIFFGLLRLNLRLACLLDARLIFALWFTSQCSTMAGALPARFVLQPVVGAHPHDQRGPDNLLQLRAPVEEGLRYALRDSGLIVPDPIVPANQCLPYWLVEGIYARTVAFDAASQSRLFATHSLSAAALTRIEDTLVRENFDFSPCSFAHRRLHRW